MLPVSRLPHSKASKDLSKDLNEGKSAEQNEDSGTTTAKLNPSHKRKAPATEPSPEDPTSAAPTDEQVRAKYVKAQLEKCKEAFSDVLTVALESCTEHDEMPGWLDTYDELRAAEEEFELAILAAETTLDATD